MEKLKVIAECIVGALEHSGFNDVTDSSGYHIIKEFTNGTDRAVDVYKSDEGGNQHYVIYCSYEDEDSDYMYTNDLSVEQLTKKLEEFYSEPYIDIDKSKEIKSVMNHYDEGCKKWFELLQKNGGK